VAIAYVRGAMESDLAQGSPRSRDGLLHAPHPYGLHEERSSISPNEPQATQHCAKSAPSLSVAALGKGATVAKGCVLPGPISGGNAIVETSDDRP
jgi:hypothetical protein